MTPNPIPFATKDNPGSTKPQLDSSISAADTSIPLKSGNGALLPQPYSTTATSAGSATLLNCTGISALVGGSAVEGKLIWNKTDGSFARITVGGVATDAITTTRLLGGTTNVWNSGDRWCIDPFVITFAKIDTTTQEFTQYEEALIVGRSTDTLTVATGGRGYNGTIANTFDADDYAILTVSSPIAEGVRDMISTLVKQTDTNTSNIATNTTSIGNIESNATFAATATGSSNAYAVALTLPAAYTTRERVYMIANHTNTGAATLNRNSLGAKTIKVYTSSGIADVSANQIQSGGAYTLIYDGTYYILLNPSAAAAAGGITISKITGASSEVTATSETAFDSKYNIASASFVVGRTFRIRVSGSGTFAAGNVVIKIKIGTVTLLTSPTISSTPYSWYADVGFTVLSLGASGTICSDGVMVSYGAATPVTTMYINGQTGQVSVTTTQTLDTTAAQDFQATITAASNTTARTNKLEVFMYS